MGESIKTNNTAARRPRKGMSMDAEKAKSKSVLREEELEEFNLRHKLPRLLGSYKQVRYGNDVRKEILEKLIADSMDVERIAKIPSAHFWISNRFTKKIDWEQIVVQDEINTDLLPRIFIKDNQNHRIYLTRIQSLNLLLRNQFTEETLSCCEEIEITATFKITRIKQIGENKAADKETPEKPN